MVQWLFERMFNPSHSVLYLEALDAHLMKLIKSFSPLAFQYTSEALTLTQVQYKQIDLHRSMSGFLLR